MIEAAVFDWGGTLDDGAWSDEIALDANRAALEAIGRTDIDAQAVNDALEAAEDAFQLESTDEVDLSVITRDCLAGIGCALTDDELEAYMHAWQRVVSEAATLHPDSLRLLDELRDRSLRIVLISNTFTPGRFLVPALEASGIGSRIDVFVFSSDHGKRKPDPSIFRHALDRLGVQPERAFFVGDRLDKDIAGAHEAGMTTVQATWFLAEESRDVAADYVAREPLDVLEIVDRCLSATPS